MRRDKGGSVAPKCVDERSILERLCQSADLISGHQIRRLADTFAVGKGLTLEALLRYGPRD
jgi:hypothetical protein